MRFSTTAVVAFILYISTGALTAPLPPLYGVQELVARSGSSDEANKQLKDALQKPTRIQTPRFGAVGAAIGAVLRLNDGVNNAARKAGHDAVRNAGLQLKADSKGGASGSGASSSGGGGASGSGQTKP